MLWALLLVSHVSATSYLLPTDLAPTHYDLQYVFDVDPASNFSFYGVVKILLSVHHPTKTIVLHAQNLTIAHDKIALSTDKGTAPSIVSHDTHDAYNFLKLHLDGSLERNGFYNLTIPFSGNLKLGLDGVYISSYADRKTQVKEYLIATQFEAISARQGFPCFDEPMMKASFTIDIGHHRDFTAASNMPIESSYDNNTLETIWPWKDIENSFKKPISQFVWNRFERSVPMSTYLVAFVVSKFAFVESPEGLAKTKFRIAARKDAVDQTQYASVIGPKVLSFFEKYFDVPYPLPKQDMVAIPDFAAGAMENWGLITYRETALLYDKEESSLTNKERVAEVIAHELAHQWFGNLVTMKWWSDLWLNEGFATYVAVKGMDAVEPQWKAPLLYSLQTVLRVLVLDSLESSHPVSVPIDDPKRISEIFDEISYMKGSTIIRMMTMFLGEEVFRKAINNYLNKYSYMNAEQDDLWAELTAVSVKEGALPPNVTVKDIMDTWTKQTGFPILNAVRNYEKGTVAISQKRFYSLKNITSTSSWWVPLSTLGQGSKRHSMQWLSKEQGVQQPHEVDAGLQSSQWLLLNPDMIAPIRVNYDERNWRLIATALSSENTHEVPIPGRVQLIDDAFALASAGLLDYELTLSLTNYLKHETEYLPLQTGLDGLGKIEKLLKRQPSYGAFQKYVRKLITDTYNKVGGIATKSITEADDLNAVKMQEMTSAWACRMKVPGCEENAIELYQNWMESGSPEEDNPIPLDLRRTVYCVGVSRGGVAQWRWLVQRRRSTNVAAAQQAMLYALACSRDTWLLHTLLEWAITDGSEVRRQDASFVIAAVARSQAGFYLAKDFIYQRIDEIYKALAGQGRRVGNVVSSLLDQFTSQKELDEFQVWFEKNKKYFDASKLSIQQGLEKAKVNIEWMKKYSKQVVEKMRALSE